MLVIYIVKGC